jgi:hypothetical protein
MEERAEQTEPTLGGLRLLQMKTPSPDVPAMALARTIEMLIENFTT